METANKRVSQLSLDLTNYRTMPQKDEASAIAAMIAIKPDYFWALMDSLLEGYLPTENIIVLKNKKGKLIVKEGNRRIAILKLILNQIKNEDIIIPDESLEKIASLTKQWKQANEVVPCLIYEESEAGIVDKIISLTHGKREKAGRDKWSSVATARHNRDVNHSNEIGLDLLEKFIQKSKEIPLSIKEKWAGDYPVTTLNEAIVKLAPRLKFTTSAQLVTAYPKIPNIDAVNSIIIDIGHERLVTKKIRSEDFASEYGIPQISTSSTNISTPNTGSNMNNTTVPTPAPNTVSSNLTSNNSGIGNTNSNNNTPSTGAVTPPTNTTTAYPLHDPKSVKQILASFTIVGKNRSKVASLRNEMQKLTLNNNPIAFCFLLRSAFEISAHAYCTDNSIVTFKMKGTEKKELTLSQVLTAVTNDLVKKNTDSNYVKKLIGAKTEITKKDGILSITTMNQLVHNPIYSITVPDICVFFNKIFPLLQEMNKA